MHAEFADALNAGLPDADLFICSTDGDQIGETDVTLACDRRASARTALHRRRVLSLRTTRATGWTGYRFGLDWLSLR